MITNKVDTQYNQLIEEILKNGYKTRNDRTGIGTVSLFGKQLRFNLNDGFPILTTKKVLFEKVIDELLWFLSGKCDNINTLPERSQILWKHWADEDGSLGRIYGCQWRDWQYFNDSFHEMEGIDQISELIHNLQVNPYSRRHIVSAWNVGELNKMPLLPCHHSFQCNVNHKNELSMLVNIRSNDMALGNPFNVPSYAVLTHMLAQVTGLHVGELIINIGNSHIYLNHVDKISEQIKRPQHELPTLLINKGIKDIDNFTANDFALMNYNYEPFIKYDVAI